jgi:hypothetical protein
MASTEPNTDAPPLTAYAHETSSFASRAARFNPVGNGIPIKRPSGIINTAAIKIRTAVVAPSVVVNIQGSTSA